MKKSNKPWAIACGIGAVGIPPSDYQNRRHPLLVSSCWVGSDSFLLLGDSSFYFLTNNP
ncbi:hypothetical protein PI95_017910 [Hassallia byssoidea VB512170]|uniref:Uncharacterized protein n=1 Tax=Hassallia byssoidea VB512170 TaxID=1304833 RepID=A0A846HCI0_9CYAN|nr:hypothetical protein [Hassalia byssoidea]NEU74384.1 hypothetical protein [Hassalia byssoidea VB512170]